VNFARSFIAKDNLSVVGHAAVEMQGAARVNRIGGLGRYNRFQSPLAMATILTRPITVEELYALPETGPFFYELHNGELVKVTRPVHKHHLLQERLVELLRPVSSGLGHVTMELAFRALPEYEFRVADVAFVSQERWDQIDPEGNLRGAPDLVIEVLSPSNTAAEMSKKKRLCLENGCREFWVLDADLRQVEVSTPNGITTTYRDGQEIPLRLFGSGALAVSAIFS
jgi:Uma2 family endonuclease